MKQFKFVILGAGGIAKKFVNAVGLLEGAEVAAVASRSLTRAQQWAREQGVPKAYGSYEQMLIEEQPDCAYVATTPNAHYELTMLCLKHKVPVLCEKAMFVTAAEARAVFEKSAQDSTFVMEALWSRFLPAFQQAKRWLDGGLIGPPVLVDTGIGFIAPKGEQSRYFSAELAGGTACDILVYAFELTRSLVRQEIKEMQVSVMWSDTGVDITDLVTVRFENALASLKTSFVTPMEERMVVYGEKGRIVIPTPHYSSEAFLYDASGALVEHFEDKETVNGFTYEISEVISCIREGRIQSETVPHRDTLECAELFDRIRQTR